MLRFAAALQRTSSYPLAVAIMNNVRDKRLPVPESQEVAALPGRGVEGLERGQKLALGSTRLLQGLGLDEGSARHAARRLESEGETVS